MIAHNKELQLLFTMTVITLCLFAFWSGHLCFFFLFPEWSNLHLSVAKYEHRHRKIESLPLNFCNGHPLPVTDNNRKWLTRSPTGIPSSGNAPIPSTATWLFQTECQRALSHNYRTLPQNLFCPQKCRIQSVNSRKKVRLLF